MPEYYAVMKVLKLDKFTAGGFELKWEDDTLEGFIPVFKTRPDAIKFDGTNEHVQRIVAVYPKDEGS